MDSHASNSLSSGKVLPDAWSFQKKSEMPKKGSCLPFAIGAITLVGGTFFLLAGCRVLPQSANLLSRMGIWGKITGLGFIVLGGGTVIVFSRKTRQENPPKGSKTGDRTSANAAHNTNTHVGSSSEENAFSRGPVFPIAKAMVQSYLKATGDTSDVVDDEVEVHYKSGFENLKRLCQREIKDISAEDIRGQFAPEHAVITVTIRCEYGTDTGYFMQNFKKEMFHPAIVFMTAKPVCKANLITTLSELKIEASTRLEKYFNIKDPVVLTPVIPGQMPVRVGIDFTLRTEALDNPAETIGFKRTTIGWWSKVESLTLDVANTSTESEQNRGAPNTSTTAPTTSSSISSSNNNNVLDGKCEESNEPANTATAVLPSVNSSSTLSNNNSLNEEVDYSKIPDFLRFTEMLDSFISEKMEPGQQIPALSDKEKHCQYIQCFDQLKKSCEEMINSIQSTELERGIWPGEPCTLIIKIKCYYLCDFAEISIGFGRPFEYEEGRDIFSGQTLSTKGELLQHLEVIKKDALRKLELKLDPSKAMGLDTPVPVLMPSRIDMDCRVTCKGRGLCASVRSSIGWWGETTRTSDGATAI